MQHCVPCDAPWFPPQRFCPRCLGDDIETRAMTGRGRLASYVVHHRDAPGFTAPYVIALVELDEGPRLLTNLVDCATDPTALPVGLPVTFRPTPVVSSDGRHTATLPLFAPADATLDAPPPGVGPSRFSVADTPEPAAGVSPLEVAFGLGITPGWVDATMVGGSSFMLHVRHALAAIEAGLATCVLITHGESGRSRVGGMPMGRRAPLIEQFELPYGVMGPPTMFTLPVLAWMDRYGVTEHDLASVAVAQRRWAADNPRALKRDPLSVDDVLDSTMVAWPFRKLMCCLVTDGGGALVVTTAERAADMAGSAVHVLGTGEAAETPMVSQMADLSASRAFRIAGGRALAEAGIGIGDIDHLMAYDAFVHTPCYALEALGVVGPGEGAAFVAEGNTLPGGRLPMNTNGGGLSYTHTGMYGMFALQESVRQVRGTAPAQVQPAHGDGVRISVAHGVGGMFAASGTVVLGAQPS